MNIGGEEGRKHCGNLDTSFLMYGMRQLLLSRQILKASYPFGYYMENERNQRTIFEFMQDDLEQTTERLSHMIARPYWTTPKSIMIDTTDKLVRHRQNFLTAVERGLVPKDESTFSGRYENYVGPRVYPMRSIVIALVGPSIGPSIRL